MKMSELKSKKWPTETVCSLFCTFSLLIFIKASGVLSKEVNLDPSLNSINGIISLLRMDLSDKEIHQKKHLTFALEFCNATGLLFM